MNLEIVILAAGKGSRMNSLQPKVLHKVGGKELLRHVIDNTSALSNSKVHIVYGYMGDKVKETIKGDYDWVYQKEQLGTGHAVKLALPNCSKDSMVLVLVSDIPLIKKETIEQFVKNINQGEIGVLTSIVENPYGLGRIKRDGKGNIVGIVEEKDCSNEEKSIREINTGIIAGTKETIEYLLSKVKNNNNQNEYYLTDIISIAHQENIVINSSHSSNSEECEGINNKIQLQKAERIYQKQKAFEYMTKGLQIIDASRVEFRGNLEFGNDCIVDVNVIFEGYVKLGNNVYISTGCVLKNCEIYDNSVISPYTIIEKSVIGENATIGPFARFRPGCNLANNVHVGNFVEVKNSSLGEGTKSGHLSYLGDSEIGKNVNIGAGTITCNYDGANKWKTIIGDDVFVGSDTQIVAPVNIDSGVTIGAGTTVTKDVSSNKLVISRSPMRLIDNWKRPLKK